MWASVKTVWLRPGTRLGFFTHMGTQFSVTVFALMWGLPYLTVGQGLSVHVAGTLLSLSVVAAILSGIVIGIFTGRRPHRRSRLVLAIIASNAAVWTVVLALPSAAPLWLLTLLVIVISVGGPGSMVGFDFARTFNPSATLGTAQGMVNMGGFLASLLVMQAMGLVIGAVGGYSFESFRLAWTVQYAIWALAMIGILITRKKARRQMQDERNLLEGFDPHPTRACGGAVDRYLLRLLTRRLAFLIAFTNWTLVMVERPEMSRRRRDIHQVRLRRVGVDAFGRGSRGIGATAARPRVGWALLGLRLPVVADLLEAVLERVVGDAVRALAFAVLLDGRVVHLGERPLRLRRRLLQRARQLALLGRAPLTSSSAWRAPPSTKR